MSAQISLKEDLTSFVQEKTDFLNGVLDVLGWTKESLDKNLKVQCPVNSNHWLPESSLSSHIKTCRWLKEGYLKEEIKDQSLASDFFYKNSKVVPVLINKEEQAKILVGKGLWDRKCLVNPPPLPKTVERSTVDLSVQQRLAIYDYCVEQSKATLASEVKVEDLVYDFDKKNDDGDKPKSHLELKAEERDYKRRRQTYRAKNVHITKKSYTEVMREVIENQVSYLTQIRKNENSDRSKSRSPNREVDDKSSPSHSKDSDHKNSKNYFSESRDYRQEKRSKHYSDHSYDGRHRKQDHRPRKYSQEEEYPDYKSRKHFYKSQDYSRERDKGYSDSSDGDTGYEKHSMRNREYSQDKHNEYKNEQQTDYGQHSGIYKKDKRRGELHREEESGEEQFSSHSDEEKLHKSKKHSKKKSKKHKHDRSRSRSPSKKHKKSKHKKSKE